MGQTKTRRRETPAGDRTVEISIPLTEVPAEAYRSTHVEVGALTRPQAEALKRLHVRLTRDGTRLSTGKPVVSVADAVRWTLDRIAEGC